MDLKFKKGRSHRVVGSGLIALDILVDQDPADRYRALGGSAGNVLAILAYLGWTSLPVARLGRDAAARHIEREFRQLGATTEFLRGDSPMRTPVIYQSSDAVDGSPHYSFRCPVCGQKRGFRDDHDTDLVDAVTSQIRGPAVFFFDRATPSTVRLAEHFRRRRGIVVFEPSDYSATYEFERCVLASHVIKYSADRIDSLNRSDLSNVFVEVQTMGHHGLKFRLPRAANEWTELAAIEVTDVADTSGAGDWCTAGALYWFLRNNDAKVHARLCDREIADALRFGQALATMNCTVRGARGAARAWPAEALVRAAKRITQESSLADSETQSASRAYRYRNDGSADIGAPPDLCCEKLAF